MRKLQRNLPGSSNYARVTCILMLGMGNSPSFVASCLGIDVSNVYRYRSAYLYSGVDELLENRYKGYWELIDSRQLAALRRELRGHIYTEVYREALARHPEDSVIYIISDNARYFHNKRLKEWVDGTNIRQIFLPPYSPNLNLIERLWKLLRKKVINYRLLQNEGEIPTGRQGFLRQYRKL